MLNHLKIWSLPALFIGCVLLIIPLALGEGASRKSTILGPYSAATNMAVAILGEPDKRPNTWGRQGADYKPLAFKPPPGYSVRILRVYGDFVAWPVGNPPAAKFAGVLWALNNTGKQGSSRMFPAADNTFLYIQQGVADRPVRAAFDFDVSAGGKLGPDHVLVSKTAVWLNETELPIHMEPTFTVVYRFERN